MGQGVRKYFAEKVILNQNKNLSHGSKIKIYSLEKLAKDKKNKYCHKKLEQNILIGTAQQTEHNINLFTMPLIIDERCELMSDHQTGQHVQGMILFAASRQAFIAVTEEFVYSQDVGRYYVINSMATTFSNFLFPLPAQVHFEFIEKHINDRRGNFQAQIRIMWKIYSATLLAITAHFAAFTYIEPWLHLQQAINTSFIPIALFVYGISGLVGNFITGILIDKYLKLMVSVSVLLVCAVLVFLGLYSASLSSSGIFISMVIWGISVSGIFVGFQTWVLRLAEDKAFPASAVYVSFFNTAIGVGASAGAWIVLTSSIPLLYIAAGMAIGLSVFLVIAIPSRVAPSQRPLEHSHEQK